MLMFNSGFHTPSIMPCRSNGTAGLTISSLQLYTFHSDRNFKSITYQTKEKNHDLGHTPLVRASSIPLHIYQPHSIYSNQQFTLWVRTVHKPIAPNDPYALYKAKGRAAARSGACAHVCTAAASTSAFVKPALHMLAKERMCFMPYSVSSPQRDSYVRTCANREVVCTNKAKTLGEKG